jgi:hypothetical protein
MILYITSRSLIFKHPDTVGGKDSNPLVPTSKIKGLWALLQSFFAFGNLFFYLHFLMLLVINTRIFRFDHVNGSQWQLL